MYMMQRIGLRKSRRLIFLGRSLASLLALTQNPSSLECGIALMVVSFSTTGAGIIHILTLLCEFIPIYLLGREVHFSFLSTVQRVLRARPMIPMGRFTSKRIR